MSGTLHPTLLDRLAAIVGPRHVLTEAADTAGHLSEPRGLYVGDALCVVRPGTTAEVAAILALCHETATAIVPQGGNTGLVGGQIPGRNRDEIVLSLRRLDRVRAIDTASNTMIVEAGLTLARAQEEAAKVDRLFPLSLGSEGSATIGGNLSTNAGGTAVLAYGNARELVNGVEVVLADGRVLNNLSTLRKDNTGYDVKNLFVGSEGTLGIITAAVLRLFPKPRSISTAMVAFADPHKALKLLTLTQARAGGDLKGFEFMPRFGIELVLKHGHGVRDPFEAPHAWYGLIELTSQAESGLEEQLTALLGEAFEQELIEDAIPATSLQQRADFWRLREQLSEVQGREGGSIKQDIAVPVARVADFLDEADAAVAALIPGVRPVAFGHMGDGNVHYNLSQPVGDERAAFLARWGEVDDAVHRIVHTYGGSISAEHGVGALKRHLLPDIKDPVLYDTMRLLKRTFDPKGILNPGKMVQG